MGRKCQRSRILERACVALCSGFTSLGVVFFFFLLSDYNVHHPLVKLFSIARIFFTEADYKSTGFYRSI